MKNFKRIISAVMAIMICLSFAACNKKTDKDTQVEVETQTPQQELEAAVDHTKVLTITKDNKKTVSLGDDADAVKKAFGEPLKERAYALEYEGATVYLSDTVNMLTINGEGYTGYKKAAVGMSIDEYESELDKEEYSVEKQEDIGFYRITIAVDENGDVIKAADISAAYLFTVTSNNYGEESTITHIQLKDNRNK